MSGRYRNARDQEEGLQDEEYDSDESYSKEFDDGPQRERRNSRNLDDVKRRMREQERRQPVDIYDGAVGEN